MNEQLIGLQLENAKNSGLADILGTIYLNEVYFIANFISYSLWIVYAVHYTLCS